MAANALILGKPRAPGEGGIASLGELAQRKWWPVRLAMFDGQKKDGGEEQPEFEMTQILQDNGVVRKFEFDYGEFSLVASLIRVEPLEAPRCN